MMNNLAFIYKAEKLYTTIYEICMYTLYLLIYIFKLLPV